jgi:hypothetical protein
MVEKGSHHTCFDFSVEFSVCMKNIVLAHCSVGMVRSCLLSRKVFSRTVTGNFYYMKILTDSISQHVLYI